MPETIPGLMKESLSWLEDKTINAYLATVEDDHPRTRPVSILWREDAVWLTSGTSNGKTQQVRRHSRVEICVPIERNDRHCYVRLSGQAEIVTAPEIRARIGAEFRFLGTY